MATAPRKPDPPLIRRLLEEPGQFSFFRAVEILESFGEQAAPIGTETSASRENIRIRPDTSYSLPRCNVTSVDELPSGEGKNRRFRLTQTLMGLYGIRAPTPEIYGDEILRRGMERDPVRDFLDLFHHRILSLLYRAWARNRPRPYTRATGTDPTTELGKSISGLRDEDAVACNDVPATPLLYFGNVLARTARNAEGLERMVTAVLDGTPVEVEPYIARWVEIPENQRVPLGQTRLDRNFVIGTRTRDRTGKFRVAIGPFKRARPFVELASESEKNQLLGALLALYLVDPLDYDVKLGIEGHAKPRFFLGERQRIADSRTPAMKDPGPRRLGVDTWFYSGRPETSWELFQRFRRVTVSPQQKEASA